MENSQYAPKTPILLHFTHFSNCDHHRRTFLASSSLVFDCAVSIHSTMSRRIQVVNIGMFDEKMLYNEDDDFWFRLSVKYGYALYDDYVSAFRRIHDSRHSLDDLKVFY